MILKNSWAIHTMKSSYLPWRAIVNPSLHVVSVPTEKSPCETIDDNNIFYNCQKDEVEYILMVSQKMGLLV